MTIHEKNKEAIKILCQTILENIDSIDSLSMNVKTNFPIKNYLPFLIKNPEWSQAVDPSVITNPDCEEDKIIRARGILRQIVSEPLENLKFMDFGCGEGHVATEASHKNTNISVGYDLVAHINWEKYQAENLLLTTDWNQVAEKGPYDIILIFDVLDHVSSEEEAVNCLIKIREALKPEGKIYVRLHPWCSRHGTHLYQQINKAFLHLCLDNQELESLGYKNIPTLKLIHPQNSYKKWFEDARLKITIDVKKEPVETFFKDSILSALIKRHWKDSHDKSLADGSQFPSYQLEQQFINIVATK